MSSSAPENPKTGVGRLKPEGHVVSEVALLWLTAALENGALKYGEMNWRAAPIPATTYLSAIKRHLGAWATGEDRAADSGLPHLAHVMAGCAILLDAEAAGSLIDNRHKGGDYDALLREISTLKARWIAEKAA